MRDTISSAVLFMRLSATSCGNLNAIEKFSAISIR